MNNFSIVIPVYNEEGSIFNLIEEIYSIKIIQNKFELIIVNDSSDDNTENILKELQNKFDIIFLNNSSNKGQSYSLLKGIEIATHDTIVTLDGDGQNNPNNIPDLLNIYLTDSELFLVGGIRIKRNDSLIKILSSKLANKIRIFILKDNCSDTGCSLKVFSKKKFMNFPFFDGIHRFLPALFHGYGLKTFFTNVDHRPRIYGYSKYGTFDRMIRGIRDIIKVAKIIKKFKKQM